MGESDDTDDEEDNEDEMRKERSDKDRDFDQAVDSDDADEGKDMKTMSQMNAWLQSGDNSPPSQHTSRRSRSKRGRRRSDDDDQSDDDDDSDYRRRLLYDYDDYSDMDSDYDDCAAYYNNFYEEEAAFTDTIRNEMDGQMMRFQFDGDWDEIHRMDSMEQASKDYNEWRPYSSAKVYEGAAIQKCKTFQTAQVCGTLVKSDGEPKFAINVKVGAHKHFKLSTAKVIEEYSALMDEDGDQLTDDENILDTFFDEEKEMDWVVSAEATNEYDAEWQDDSQWSDVEQFTTFSAKKLKKKCMSVFGRKLCLCEFIGFVAHKKHVCHPNKAMTKKQQQMKKKLKLKKIKKNEMLRRKRLAKEKQKMLKKEKKEVKKEKKRIHKENKLIKGENVANKKMQIELKKCKRKIKRLQHKLHQQQMRNKHGFHVR